MTVRFALVYVALSTVLLATISADSWSSQSAMATAPPGLSTVEGSMGTLSPPPQTNAPTQPRESDCQPEASLRPHGPLPEPGQMPAGSTMARIFDRGQLIAGVDQDTHLFGYRNPDTRELQGFDIDIVHDITEAIFGDPHKVDFRQLSTAEQLYQVATGSVDIVVGTISITCERRTRMAFSTAYFQAGQRVLVNRGSGVTGLHDLPHRPVCASRGSTSLRHLLGHPAEPTPVGAPNVTDCLVKLQLGEVDAVSTDDALLAGLVAQDPRTEIVGPALTDEPYGVAIHQDASDLVRFVNAVLARRSADGRWMASYQRWLAPWLTPLANDGTVPSPPEPQYRD